MSIQNSLSPGDLVKKDLGIAYGGEGVCGMDLVAQNSILKICKDSFHI